MHLRNVIKIAIRPTIACPFMKGHLWRLPKIQSLTKVDYIANIPKIGKLLDVLEHSKRLSTVMPILQTVLINPLKSYLYENHI